MQLYTKRLIAIGLCLCYETNVVGGKTEPSKVALYDAVLDDAATIDKAIEDNQPNKLSIIDTALTKMKGTAGSWYPYVYQDETNKLWEGIKNIKKIKKDKGTISLSNLYDNRTNTDYFKGFAKNAIHDGVYAAINAFDENYKNAKIQEFVTAYLAVNSEVTGKIAKEKLAIALQNMHLLAIDLYEAEKFAQDWTTEAAERQKDLVEDIEHFDDLFAHGRIDEKALVNSKINKYVRLAEFAGLGAGDVTLIKKELDKVKAKFESAIDKKAGLKPPVKLTEVLVSPANQETNRLLIELAERLAIIAQTA